jgi:Zn-dependent M28 family amino/carboxypeptidase
MRMSSDRDRVAGVGLGPDETVDLAGMDSFPASDPPSWSVSHAGVPTEIAGPYLLRDVVQQVHDDVRLLSESIGERHDRSVHALENLERAAAAIERRFSEVHLPVKRRAASDRTSNIEAVIRGGARASESVVVGAHYDSARGSPGAEDNASGVAALLVLAHGLANAGLPRTIRLVAFASEQPPHASVSSMGSAGYSNDLEREGVNVTAMMSLDSLGLYHTGVSPRFTSAVRSDLLVIGDRDARAVLTQAEQAFARVRSGISISTLTWPLLFAGIRSSSHWSFARRGVPAFMVTDAAPLWSGSSGAGADTADRLDYDRLGRVSLALCEVVSKLAGRVS